MLCQADMGHWPGRNRVDTYGWYLLFSSWCLRRDNIGEWVTPGLFDIVGLADIAASGSR